MLEDFLQDIYDKALALEMVKEASFYSSIRHLTNRRDYWNEASEALEKIIYDIKDDDLQKGVALMESSLKAQESYQDWHKFSAVIDAEVVPKIQEYLKKYTGINVTENNWTLESATTGFLTVKNHLGDYLHSPLDPMWESFLYAYSIFDPAARAYYILGGGLGYLAYSLWRMSEGEADIYVFEVDETLSVYAEKYGVISLIEDEKIHYITGDDTDIILEKYSENIPDTKIVRTMYYWDLGRYNGPYADFFKIEYSNEVTSRIFEKKWRSNYDWNMSMDHKYFSDLDTNVFKDEWIVVGSGPSLNYNEDFLRESVGKRTICCVNSSLKWFYLHGIKPDLCTVCDPTDMLVPHIEGFEDFSEDVPIIADVVSNRKYMELYKGPKYYIYSSAAVLTVGKDNIQGGMWAIGGTVTSLALAVALKLKAKKCYLIGADLGYPDGVTFADGVGHDVGKWNGAEGTEISVDDKIIATSIKFREYKCMIEEQIKLFPETEVINRSRHGAYLKGSFCDKWWENIPNSTSIQDYYGLFENLTKESRILNWNSKYFIFWQILGKMHLNGVTTSEDGLIRDAYKAIYNSFKEEMHWTGSFDSKINSCQTYIFTDEFINQDAPDTKRVLDIAKSKSRSKQNVLIVNTTEKLGGENVAIHDKLTPHFDSELEKEDKVYYQNCVFQYFQFSKGMPDIRSYVVFLDTVAKNRPGRMVITSPYSLLADYCSEMLQIPTEIIASDVL